MKKFFKFLSIALLSITTLTSCDEDIINNDSPGAVNSNGLSLAGFKTIGSQFDLFQSVENDLFRLTIELEVSSTKNVDRTINFDLADVSFDASQYTIESAIIPANSHYGEIVLTFDRSLFSVCDYKFMTINLTSIEGATLNNEKKSYNLKVGIPVDLDNLNGDWESETWLWDDYLVNEIVINQEANTIVIKDFFYNSGTNNRDFVLNYDPNSNVITFANQYVGFNFTDAGINANNAPVTARLNSGSVSKFDPCTGEISLYIDYLIGTTGYAWLNINERFYKI